ncbi:MAG: hypothetical protein WBM45_14705, partial [Woeseiaceae bacterium]
MFPSCLPGARIAALSAIVTLSLATAAPALGAGKPQVAPKHSATKLDAAPVIDGNITGDAAWNGALPATGFWQVQPTDGMPATQRTEVYIGFTGDALYVGVVAFDDDPTGIIVSDSRRDSSLD